MKCVCDSICDANNNNLTVNLRLISISQFNARFRAQRHYQGRLPNLDRPEMTPPSHSNLENKEGKSKKTGQIRIR